MSWDKPSYSTSEVAEILGTNITKVGQLIRAGELPAINAALSPNARRPRYRILAPALQEFLERRSVVPQRRAVAV